MALPPERPVSDPLLEPDVGSLDVTGGPVRAPIGNSIRTLLLLGLLVAVGITIWLLRRPSDLTGAIGGREWVIVDVDGEPAVNEAGLASTFVLDGTHEVRGMVACNTATGRWTFETSSQRLDLEWHDQSLQACPDDWPTTYSVDEGRVEMDDGAMTIATDDGPIRSIAPADRPPASADELAGRWATGPSVIEFGPRGLLRIDGCTGTWTTFGAGIEVAIDDAELARDLCDPAPIWTAGAVIVPVRFEDSLYLRRDDPSFPLDRQLHRLDALPDGGSLLLDGP